MVKLAIVVQPSLKISGGDQVINTLYKGFKQKYDINLVCLCPINLDNKFKRCFKFFFKFFRSKFSKFGNKPQLIRQSSLKKYDYVLVGWNEDCASILKTNYPKDRIIHICQSFETWANDVYSSRIIYNNKIHRLSVANWLSDCMQKQSLNNFFIGNCIQDSFFENQKNINFSKKKIYYLSFI